MDGEEVLWNCLMALLCRRCPGPSTVQEHDGWHCGLCLRARGISPNHNDFPMPAGFYADAGEENPMKGAVSPASPFHWVSNFCLFFGSTLRRIQSEYEPYALHGSRGFLYAKGSILSSLAMRSFAGRLCLRQSSCQGECSMARAIRGSV